MNLVANKKNLRKYGKDLLGNEYSPEKLNELIHECTSWLSSPHNLLHRIDKILGNHGVESIYEWRTGGSVDATNAREEDIIDIQCSNAGDAYAMTIFYWNGKFRIGDWGSVVERLQKH